MAPSAIQPSQARQALSEIRAPSHWAHVARMPTRSMPVRLSAASMKALAAATRQHS
jgi:hypothetical protein